MISKGVRSLLVNYLTKFSADAFYLDIERAKYCLVEGGLNKPAIYALLAALNPQ